MSAHTPGPWLQKGETIYALMHHEWRKGVEQFKNRFSAHVQHDKECSAEEAEANARLISAAPDLLEALQVSRAQWIHSANADKCLAAIAKATGGAA